MNKCSCCKKEKLIEYFIKGNKTLKNCNDCRDTAKQWRSVNKERIQKYNKMFSDNVINKTTTYIVICARKTGDNEWIEYKNRVDAANKLELKLHNVNKAIKENLKTTGGYEFKTIEKQRDKIVIKTWEEIKKENNFEHKQQGKPAPHRIKHEERDSKIGKICCTCKEWKSLNEYNKATNHWDNLRNDCKGCLTIWRKENRININKNMKIYEKNRKEIDAEFKLLKTLRSRVNSALKSKNAEKNTNTLDLTGCTVQFLIEYLRAKFTEGMSWENHGRWHIDHIKPCAKFNLTNEEEQRQCFHYTNLQPLWAADNLSKGAKF